MSISEVDVAARLREAVVALKKVRSERDALLRSKHEPIAIVGMACRFPGGATSPESFWRLLVTQSDAVTEVPAERWALDPSAQGSAEGPARAVRWGAFIKDADRFDSQFFGISPREAERMDPQQRLLLEVTWEALERGGIVPAQLMGTRAGVFIAMTTNDYAALSGVFDSAVQDVYTLTGNGHCFPAGRISYTLGLQGPSLTVDTACSSSLVALHLACQSLRMQESDLALVGGVNLMLSPATANLIAQTSAISPDGRCRTFDAQANGVVRGEGCGVIVLKRLSDAERNGDPILALIRGSAVNQDGRSTGLTVPNALAQQAMLRQALQNAGVAAAEVGYIEAHGTATPLGDPIEVDALVEVIGRGRDDRSVCALGAVKTNIGHLEAAAGIAGVIKIVLALQHETIPGILHFKALNPRISFQGTPFVIPTTKMPWPAPATDKPRIAGVSSFGLSGTNAHVILSEAPRAAPAARRSWSAYLLPISAKTEEALVASARAYGELLSQSEESELHDIAYTAGARRSHHEHRLSVVGRSKKEMADALSAFLRDDPAAGCSRGRALGGGQPKIVFVFPGQGSQWLGMGRELSEEEPVFRSALAACDAAIRAEGGFSVLEELLADEGRSRLHEIDVIQPLLFAIAVSLAALWRSWGVEPSAVIGHSMGEVAAAYVAGALSLEDAARIICRRSRLLRRISGRGAMALVELSMADAALALVGYEDRLSIAVSNGPRSTVLSGDPGALSEVLSRLEEKTVFCRRIKADVASHSPQVDPLRDDLLAALRDVAPRKGSIPLRSTVTGREVRGPELTAPYWLDNLRKPVLFSGAVTAESGEGRTIFVEMSPHPILLTSMEETLKEGDRDAAALPSLRRQQRERQSLMESLGALYTHGFPVDFARQFPEGGRLVTLPTYHWQRQRFWFEAPPSQVGRSGATHPRAGQDALDECVYAVTWRDALGPQRRSDPAEEPRRVLIVLDRGGTGAALAEALGHRGHIAEVLPYGEGVDSVECVRRAIASGGPVYGIAHLAWLDVPSAEGRALGDHAAAATELCTSLSDLLPDVVQGASPPRLWLVTRHAQPVSEGGVSVAQASLWGLGRVFALEHPEAWGGLIDLGDRTDDEGQRLADAILMPGDEDQIAFRGVRTLVARLTPTRLAPVAEPLSVREDRAYLVTGGLSGLGLCTARWLAQRGARHLVLTSRSGVPDRARWDDDLSPEARARVDAIRSLEAIGAAVVAVAADAADPVAMATAIQRAAHPIGGVVHSAGAASFQLLAEPGSRAALREAFHAKVDGTRVLYELTRGAPLDFFVMFSSVAAIWGSKGLGHYAAANHFMDAAAHALRAQGVPALSLNLGAIAGGGLLRGDAEQHSAAVGIRTIDAELMLLAMERALAQGVAQRTLARVDWRVLKPVYESRRERPLLYETIPEEAVRPDPAPSRRAGRWPLLSGLREAATTERHQIVSRFLLREAAGILRLDPSALEPNRQLAHYGMDSLMAVELRKRLEAATGVKLSVAEIWRLGQVDKLAFALLPLLDASLSVAEPDDAPIGAQGDDGHVTAPKNIAVVEPAPEPPRAADPCTERAPAKGRWIFVPRPIPDAKARLFCFPYAGGGAPVYAEWPHGLPPGVELCIVAPPGRHGRSSEPLPDSVGEMVSGVVSELGPYLDRPFAMFGHCLGAIVMFEVARELRAKDLPRPIHLFASGSPPPRRYLFPRITLGGNARLAGILQLIGFAKPELLDDEALDELLPPVVADFDAASNYRYAPSPPLDVPITTFAAQDDFLATPDIVEQWRLETTASFTKLVYSGEHYFLVPERAAIEAVVGETLTHHIAAIEQRYRARGGDEGTRRERLSGAASMPSEPPLALQSQERPRHPALEPICLRPAAKQILVCFPCAGGDAALFRAWPDLVPEDIEVCAVELPGGGTRAAEMPLGDIDAMVDGICGALLEHLGRPFAFFGHDIGAILMYEVARSLRRRGAPLPRHLFPSASMAPHIYTVPSLHRLPNTRFLDALRLFGAAVHEQRAERKLRADFAAMAAYVSRSEPPLDVPITAFIGDRDDFVSAHGVLAWKEVTTGRFEMHTVPGDHGFIGRDPATAVTHVIKAMDVQAGTPDSHHH